MSSVLPPDSSTPESSPRQAYRLMAGMALVAMALIGIVIYSLSQMNQSATQGTSLPAPTIHPTLRQDLPRFEYTDEGKGLIAQNMQGKWTLLSFWADWCAPCLQEMPALNQLYQQW